MDTLHFKFENPNPRGKGRLGEKKLGGGEWQVIEILGNLFDKLNV